MHLETGRIYRAKTASETQITFTVLDSGDGIWIRADVDSAEGPEPNVWLNTRLLLWISLESRLGEALDKAADEVIEVLERTETEPSDV